MSKMVMSNCWTPYFSIVIPTYRRLAHLSNLFSSLTHLKYQPSMFEVIVVDDGGGIPLEPIISKFRGHMNITLLRQENRGPAMARNYGASHAKGEYLAFADDDCRPDPKWLQALAHAFGESPCCVCGGKTINALIDNPYSTASQLLVDYLYEHYSPTKNIGAFFFANNFAVARERFQEMGGFDSTLRFGEDRDFCCRWRRRGYSFVFAPDAVMYHAHTLNLSSFLQLHFLYGGGNFQFLRRCAAKGTGSIRLSPPSWYIKLMLSGIMKEKSLWGLLLTLLLTAAQGAYTAGLFWEAIKNRPL
jgi:glycosyltransferase involved in cell wall biosynthesis